MMPRHDWVRYADRLAHWENSVRIDPHRPRHVPVNRFIQFYVDHVYYECGRRKPVGKR